MISYTRHLHLADTEGYVPVLDLSFSALPGRVKAGLHLRAEGGQLFTPVTHRYPLT